MHQMQTGLFLEGNGFSISRVFSINADFEKFFIHIQPRVHTLNVSIANVPQTFVRKKHNFGGHYCFIQLLKVRTKNVL